MDTIFMTKAIQRLFIKNNKTVFLEPFLIIRPFKGLLGAFFSKKEPFLRSLLITYLIILFDLFMMYVCIIPSINLLLYIVLFYSVPYNHDGQQLISVHIL